MFKAEREPVVLKPIIILLLFELSLKKKEEDVEFKKFISMFNKLLVNIPLVDTLLKIPDYAKLMKEFVTRKRTMDSYG